MSNTPILDVFGKDLNKLWRDWGGHNDLVIGGRRCGLGVRWKLYPQQSQGIVLKFITEPVHQGVLDTFHGFEEIDTVPGLQLDGSRASLGNKTLSHDLGYVLGRCDVV